MKTRYIVLSFLFVFAALVTVQGQKKIAGSVKKENIKVWGECGMCKKKIETASKNAGASAAEWNEDSKMLTVSYTAGKTNAVKIQQAIAAAGYDTKAFTATEEAYNKLPGCCQYERKDAAKEAKESCCKDGAACAKNQACCKDAACAKENSACKEKGCCKS